MVLTLWYTPFLSCLHIWDIGASVQKPFEHDLNQPIIYTFSAKPLPSPNLKLKYQIQDESPEPTIPEPKKVVIPTLKERPKSSTLEVPKAEVISTPKFKPRPKTSIANVATTKIRMVKGKTVEVPPTPSKGAIFWD